MDKIKSITFNHLGDLNDLYESIEKAKQSTDYTANITVTHDQLAILDYLLSHIELKPVLKGEN